MSNNPDENIKEWVKKMVRKHRLKEIEFADKREYERAIEIRDGLKGIVEEIYKLYPYFSKEDKEMIWDN